MMSVTHHAESDSPGVNAARESGSAVSLTLYSRKSDSGALQTLQGNHTLLGIYSEFLLHIATGTVFA